MKKLFVFCLSLFIFFINNQTVFAQQTSGPVLTAADYEKMIDNYDGWFKNHKKTDGIKIDPQRLADILNRYKGQQVAIMYARYLNKTPPVNGKKRRVTLLLKILVKPKGAGAVPPEDQFEYIDLGFEFSLCPPPPDCFSVDQN